MLDLTMVELLAVGGVGAATELELGDLFAALHHRFSDVSKPRRESLDGYFEVVCPRPPAAGRAGHAHAALQRFLGLHPGVRPLASWPSPQTIADDLGISEAQVGRVVSKACRTWLHPSRRRIRLELKRILEDHGGVIAAVEMAGDLLGRLGSAASREVRRLRAAAIVRAGVEGEMSRGPREARFQADRRRGEVFVVLNGAKK